MKFRIHQSFLLFYFLILCRITIKNLSSRGIFILKKQYKMTLQLPPELTIIKELRYIIFTKKSNIK